MEAVIGIDIGTQSTKALLVDADGRRLAQASAAYRVDQPAPLHAEQWPQVWERAVEQVVRDCVDRAGIRPDSVQALCVSSLYGGSGIPVDAEMNPLHPCLIWMDRRATAQVDWVREHVDLDALKRITGNGVDSYYGFTKMLWLKRNRPDVWQRTRYLLPPNSYINYRLTGEVAVDHSSAGNIGGVYDLAERRWSSALLDILGIPERFMPERLVDSGDIVGRLSEEAAGRLGLPSGTPVVAGGVDAAMATLAAGVTEPGHQVAMIGTSMCWGFLSDSTDADRGLISMPYVNRPDRDLYVFGGAITAGASVSWFRDVFAALETDLADRLPGVDAHDLLALQAQKVPAGSDGLLFLPYLMGERSPVWDAGASGGFIGLTLNHGRGHCFRAVLEGVAFALRDNIECGRVGFANLQPTLTVVGGAAHSDLWMRIIADVTGFPVRTIEGDVEAPLGGALLAAKAASLIDDVSVIHRWSTLVDRARPDPDRHRFYSEQFELYRGLYPALTQTMRGLNRLKGSAS